MSTAPRYGLYFAPAPDSPWWEAGCHWLGRDPARAIRCPQPALAGVSPSMLEKLTADARRYGFHATLKAPFRLAGGFSESHLALMAQSFADVQHPIPLERVQVCLSDDYLTLRPAAPLSALGALAMRCVSYFDTLRAAAAPAELAHRRCVGLSARQEALLQRWGYPYVEEEFRFHMTLSDSLAAAHENVVHALRKAAEARFAQVLEAAPLVIDALTVFREDEPGAPFSVWQRFPFRAHAKEAALRASGRLFYCVGPSGAGKDTLLQWVKRHAPAGARLRLAQRTVTRPSHPSEAHEASDEDNFWKLAAAGHFAMAWQANGLCYGIRRGIEAELKAGFDVLVNGSREYVPRLLQSFPEARVVWIEADPARIRERLEARRRESGSALRQRLERATQFAPPQDDRVIRLDNSGLLEVAGKNLLRILSSC